MPRRRGTAILFTFYHFNLYLYIYISAGKNNRSCEYYKLCGQCGSTFTMGNWSHHWKIS